MLPQIEDNGRWKKGEGNEWENIALFDCTGNALNTLDIISEL
jgi:arabinogalactan endo-1,4-beta-galactosidase